MTTTVSRKPHPFAAVPTALINDERVSLKAKGLYAYMLSKPENWTFYIKSMVSQLKEGKESIYSALKELVDHGWVKRYQSRTEAGGFGNNHFELLYKCDISTASGKPVHGKAVHGKPAYGKPATSKKDISKKEGSKKQVSTKPAGCRIETFFKCSADSPPQVPADWANWASLNMGWTQDEIDIAFADFFDHWSSSNKANAIKRSWIATWRKACRQWLKPKKENGNGKQSKTASIADAIAGFAD